jgi:SPP1 family predicted phage head-tail adaptor
MQAGKLNKRVTPQSPSSAQDANGELVPGWTNFISGDNPKVSASIKDISGREFVAAGATQNETTTSIVVRYRAGYKKSMRIIYEDDVYNVLEVLGQDKTELTLMCKRMT